MMTSIKTGLTMMPSCEAFFLLPGDMPIVDKNTYLAVYNKMLLCDKTVVFPEIDGKRKHPPLIKASFINKIMNYEGIGGLRELWKYHENEIAGVSVDDSGCSIDLDTYEDYKKCII